MTINTPYPMGIQGCCYVGAVGTVATPTTTPTVLLSDDQKVEISITNGVAQWATRGKRLKNSSYTDQEVAVSMTVVKNNSNAAFLQMQAAAQSQSFIAIKAIDSLAGYGIDADWAIKTWKEGQPIEGNDTIDVELVSNQLSRSITWINSPGS